MTKKHSIIALILSAVSLISADQMFAQNWPGWRGDGHGISPEKNLPLKWSEEDGVSSMRYSALHRPLQQVGCFFVVASICIASESDVPGDQTTPLTAAFQDGRLSSQGLLPTRANGLIT